jgi:hypothetical protein
MHDDEALITALEAAGHQDVAKAMKTKSLAAELRALGRDDVAAQLEGQPTDTTPKQPASAGRLGEIVNRAHQQAGATSRAEEDAMADKVVEALDRDIPSWRGES